MDNNKHSKSFQINHKPMEPLAPPLRTTVCVGTKYESMHRPHLVSSTHFAPFTSGRDAQFFAVFCHRPPRYRHVVLLESIHNMLVGERLLTVFLFHYFLDGLLYSYRRGALPLTRFQPAVEKILEAQNTLRRIHILACRNTTHGRFVHPDILRHIPQNQGF